MRSNRIFQLFSRLACFHLAAQITGLCIDKAKEHDDVFLARHLDACVQSKVEHHAAIDRIACKDAALARVLVLFDTEQADTEILPLPRVQAPNLGAHFVQCRLVFFALATSGERVVCRGCGGLCLGLRLALQWLGRLGRSERKARCGAAEGEAWGSGSTSGRLGAERKRRFKGAKRKGRL